ncbi:hypothetical protein FEM48_Zijuj12G0162400 [Ziziphus jujuba var. spinosa]|uniref:Pentatricopeptide repeat-containing protein n=1 Tax=Ziziphus jujuba var. spinosa TaxID=714518 RepID=A0A978UEC2_ZIZJJ|nr:hypothetical protein FEM48_Zijuj12G0162400 [Ziziphus jujuba var. spinosa]
MKLRLYGRFTNVLQYTLLDATDVAANKAILTLVYSALLNCYARAKLVKKAEAVIQQMKHMGFARILSRMETDPEVLDWSTYSAAANGCRKAGLVDKAFSMLKKLEELILTAKIKSTAYECILTQYTSIDKKDEVLRLWELFNKNLKKGLIEQAESLFNQLIEKGGKTRYYLKGKGDLEGAEETITLVRDKSFVSEDTHERVLDYIKDGESNAALPFVILVNAIDEYKEPSTHLAVEEEGS